MTVLLLVIGFVLMIAGLLGSFLPVLPGIPLSWIGLLMLFLIPGIEMDYWILGITLVFAVLIYILNFVVPAMGTKRYGGSKYGMIGCTLGLIIGIFTPLPFTFLIFPFIGAFIGELLNKANSKNALRAAYGSFLGFLASTFMEFTVCIIYFGIFIYEIWNFKSVLFS